MTNFTFSCLGDGFLLDLVLGCLRDISEMHTREDRHMFILERVRRCVNTEVILDKNGDVMPSYNWTLGEAPGPSIGNFCRFCFGMCYGVGHGLVDTCCKEVRPDGQIPFNRRRKSSEPLFNDKVNYKAKEDKEMLKDIEQLVNSKGLNLSAKQRALMLLPNTERALDAFTWMDRYFTDYGEHVPNSEEIHLEHVEIKTIWTEFVADQHANHAISYNQFCELWHTCFPLVRIREYKQCCAKCTICFKLSEARRGTSDRAEKSWFTDLHGLHRSMYMGERATYAERRNLARQYPERYLSTISDGMAQLHCLLPYFANKFTVS